MHTCDQLNAQFALAGSLTFSEVTPGLPVAQITTPMATASVAVQGAQVLSWQPAGTAPVVWTSRVAVHQPGKGVRGGAPVCWPWFGAQSDGRPAHGFVRTRLWQVRSTSRTADGSVLLVLGMTDDEQTRALWPHAFDLELQVLVGQTLTMSLITRNTGAEAFVITQGLHTYFQVGDITQTRVLGLENTRYLDKVTGGEAVQSGAVSFVGEMDRIYVDTTADTVIDDVANDRQIRIAKAGSASTVVWNPWSEKEKGFADMAAGEYRDMLCVETTNAGPDVVSVPAGGSHTLTALVSVSV